MENKLDSEIVRLCRYILSINRGTRFEAGYTVGDDHILVHIFDENNRVQLEEQIINLFSKDEDLALSEVLNLIERVSNYRAPTT